MAKLRIFSWWWPKEKHWAKNKKTPHTVFPWQKNIEREVFDFRSSDKYQGISATHSINSLILLIYQPMRSDMPMKNKNCTRWHDVNQYGRLIAWYVSFECCFYSCHSLVFYIFVFGAVAGFCFFTISSNSIRRGVKNWMKIHILSHDFLEVMWMDHQKWILTNAKVWITRPWTPLVHTANSTNLTSLQAGRGYKRESSHAICEIPCTFAS